MYYKKLSIKKFRGIKDLTVENFKKVNLFVGKSNCGKSTILEALFISIAPANSALTLKINLFRGLNIIDENSLRSLFYKLSDNSEITISTELDKPKQKRTLIIKPNITTLLSTIKTTVDGTSELDIKDNYSGLSSTVNGLISSYSILEGDKENKGTIKAFIDNEKKTVQFKPTNQDYKESMQGAMILSNLRIDISAWFYDSQIKMRLQKIVKILAEIEPSLKDLSMGPYETIYCDVGFDRLMPINAMGSGLLKFLSILLAIQKAENGAIFIDEVENGLHCSLQKFLWGVIFKAAEEFNVQVFAATHSIECVRAFNHSYSQNYPEGDDIRLYRVEKEDNKHEVVTYNNKDLTISLENRWEIR